MNHYNSPKWALALLAFGTYATTASGASLTVLFQSSTGSAAFAVDRTVDSGANWYGQDPGQFHFITLAGGGGIVPNDFFTFCIEPREFVTVGQTYTYNIVPVEQGANNIGGMGVTKANFVRELLYDNYPNFSVALTPLTAAAIQVALWEIVREDSGSFNLDTGTVQYRNWANDSVRVLATSMLGGLTGNGPYLSSVSALTLNGSVQDTLVQTTPEPAAFLVVAPALIVLAIRRRRNKAKG